MEITCLKSLTDGQAQDWADFLNSAKHQHPRQDIRFAHVERALGQEVVFAIGRSDGVIQAVGIFSKHPHRFLPGRYSVAIALSGPVCDSASNLVGFVTGIAEHEEFKNVDALSITPYWLGDEIDDLQAMLKKAGFEISDTEPYRNTGLIDLGMDEDELRASFSRSARRTVRLIDKSEVEIREVKTRKDAEEFFERLNTLVIARHNLTPVLKPEIDACIDHIYNDPTIGVIFCAYHNDTFLGGLLLYRSGRVAHARRYVADPTAAKVIGNLRVAPALWLEGLLWAKLQGCALFDVEGFLPVEDKNHKNFNVYEYKREFKPTYERRLAENTIVLRPFSHAVANLPERLKSIIKGVLPEAALQKIRTAIAARRGGS